MAIQANALPPSLLAELTEMKRRLTALERKPKLGSVNERLPFSSFQTPDPAGTAGGGTNGLGAINTTGLNQPVLIMTVPFAIPQSSTGPRDVSITIWLNEMATGARSREFTIDKTSDWPAPRRGQTRTVTWSWIHPQPIGFDDELDWKAFTIDYRVNRRDSTTGQTVGLGSPMLITGVPLGTFLEEATDGNPRVGGILTPTDGSPPTWGEL
ncbi:hypothetical protein HXS80_15885 [Streptomyces sp. CB04723]|uniref:hypothetical protein n=1 Tax=Streptomyces TaxID=1883 RepID=UPI0015C4245B|nr:hypothetical protein [Streptomyces sp. CB04723]QLG33009.1 hypothetical protein HXS80_15885 [Streptomyces sp. CB04723]